MCLAVPSEVVEIRDRIATVDVAGVRREVSLLILPEEVGIGDYVLVHAGFAIHKINQEAAAEALELFKQAFEGEPDSVPEVGDGKDE